MRDEETHIGDIVRIREWNDLLQEYGIYEHDKLNLVAYLLPPKELCGKEFTVIEIERDYKGEAYAFKGLITGTDILFWIRASVLELPIDKEWCVATDDEIKALFDAE